MLKNYGLQVQLTIYTGILLLISNLSMFILLYTNFEKSLYNFNSPINSSFLTHFIPINNANHTLIYLSLIIIICSTLIGTSLTYFMLGGFLKPIKKLSAHMERVATENLVETIDLSSDTKEIQSLISSFTSMTNKIKLAFSSQKRIAAFIAHQFRTPLSVLQTQLDIYKKESSEESCLELIKSFDLQVNKLSTLVTKMLEITEIERHKLKDIIPIDILFEEIIEDLEFYATKEAISINLSLENLDNCNQQPEIIGDHTLLYQAFYNIVENGIKYNKHGGDVNINVLNSKEKLVIQISDTGYGIPKSDRANIFEAFYRCENSSTKNKPGHGIGLTFAKKVFEHHSGSLEYKSVDSHEFFEIILKNNIKKGD